MPSNKHTLWDLTADMEELDQLLESLSEPIPPKLPPGELSQLNYQRQQDQRRLIKLTIAMAPDTDQLMEALDRLKQKPYSGDSPEAMQLDNQERFEAQAFVDAFTVPNLSGVLNAATVKSNPNSYSNEEWQEANDTLDSFKASLQGWFQKKLDGWVRVYFVKKRQAEAAEAECKRLRAVQAVNENGVNRIKSTLYEIFERLDFTKMTVTAGTVSIRKAGGLPSVRVKEDPVTGQPMDWDPCFASPVTVSPVSLIQGSYALYEYLQTTPPAEVTKQAMLACFNVDPDELTPNRDLVLPYVTEDGEAPAGLEVYRSTYLDIR